LEGALSKLVKASSRVQLLKQSPLIKEKGSFENDESLSISPQKEKHGAGKYVLLI